MASSTGSGSPHRLTIEQLAAQSGMSVRNIRAHQAKGLLPPPEVRVRVGYYGPEHVVRLRLIRDLQGEGFNLGGIKRLIDDTTGTLDRLQHFQRALTEPHEERPETLTLAALGRRFRVDANHAPEVLAFAQRLGLLLPRDDGTYEVPSPSLLALAEEVVARGISLDAALGVFEELELHCDAVARAFVRLFITQVWSPFERTERPAEGWPDIDEAIDGLRPLASDALLAIFWRQLKTQIEAAFGDMTEGLIGRQARSLRGADG